MRYTKYALLAAVALFCLMPETAEARQRYYYGRRGGGSSVSFSFGYSNFGRHGGYDFGVGYSRGGYYPRYYRDYTCFGPVVYRPRYYVAPTYYCPPPRPYVRYYDAPTYYYRAAPRRVYRDYYYESGPIYRNTRVYFRDDYYR